MRETVEVLVIVSGSPRRGGIRAVAERCAELGLLDVEMIEESGLIVGRIEPERIPELRALEGVDGAEQAVVHRTL